MINHDQNQATIKTQDPRHTSSKALWATPTVRTLAAIDTEGGQSIFADGTNKHAS
jgi:hypothetical protein